MVFNVPEVGRFRLMRAPLAQALVQVTFPLVGRFQTLAGVAPLQEELADELPYMEQEQGTQFTFAINNVPVPSPQPESTITWKFSDDSGSTLAVAPGNVILSVGSNYQGVDDFAQRLSHVLTALVKTAQLRRCDRLGVRYVDVIVVGQDDPKGWTRWLRPELTGWAGDGILGDKTTLQSQLAQTQLSAPLPESGPNSSLTMQALVRHGLLPAGSAIPGLSPTGLQSTTLQQLSYILDLDLSIQQYQLFNVQDLIDQFRTLHAQIDAFFRWSLTDEGAQHFGLEEL